jgi:hypothetical protein
MPPELLLKHIREAFEYCHRDNKKRQQIPHNVSSKWTLYSTPFGNSDGSHTSLWASALLAEMPVPIGGCL